MNLAERLYSVKDTLPPQAQLVAVSKFHPSTVIMEAYTAGQRLFGESRVQELIGKYEELPKDIQWHFIGHLQINKIKYIAPFIDTIQSVDSIKLLNELNKYAEKFNRKINILIQIHISEEETKYGFSYTEAKELFTNNLLKDLPFLRLKGLMGIATLTDEKEKIQKEFSGLKTFFNLLKNEYLPNDLNFNELSMGMSDDYPIAIEEGSTMIRVGSKIFGQRQYNNKKSNEKYI